MTTVASVSFNVEQTNHVLRHINGTRFNAERENAHPLALVFDVTLSDGRVLLARTRRWDNRNVKSFTAEIIMADGSHIALPVSSPDAAKSVAVYYHKKFYAPLPDALNSLLGLPLGSTLHQEITAAVVEAEAKMYVKPVEAVAH